MTWVDIFGITVICVYGFIVLCLLIYLIYGHIVWWKDKRKHYKHVKKLTKDFIEIKLNPKKLNSADILDWLLFIKDKKKWCKILIKAYKNKIKELLQGDNNE